MDEIEHGGDAILAAKYLRIVLAAALAGACAHQAADEQHPLANKIWDTRAGAFVSQEVVFERAARPRYVILGETHDNPEHHRLQRVVLEAMAARGRRSVLAMEQFDSQYQAEMEAARARDGDAEALADAGHFDRKGWNWPLYKPLVQLALESGWPLAAANLSRSEARAIVASPSRSGLPPPSPFVRSALERDLVDGHCGVEPPHLAGMVAAQRARDARMAEVMSRYPSTVLIAGSGHAQRDRGVPLYLAAADLISIAFVEVEAENTRPADFLSPATFDYVWFTPRARRNDPCAQRNDASSGLAR